MLSQCMIYKLHDNFMDMFLGAKRDGPAKSGKITVCMTTRSCATRSEPIIDVKTILIQLTATKFPCRTWVFHELANRVRASGTKFFIEPHLRFRGAPGEQWTMFFKDPSGNNLEFKAMEKPENLFAKYNVADI